MLDVSDIVVHAISYGTEWRFRRTFIPGAGFTKPLRLTKARLSESS